MSVAMEGGDAEDGERQLRPTPGYLVLQAGDKSIQSALGESNYTILVAQTGGQVDSGGIGTR